MTKSKLAILSFICGLISLLLILQFFGILFNFGIGMSIILIISMITTILGVVSLVVIKKNPKLEGKGFAIIGLILGLLVTIFLLFVYYTMKNLNLSGIFS